MSRAPSVVVFYGLPLAGKRTTLRFVEGALNPTEARAGLGETAGPAYEELLIKADGTPILLRALSYSVALRDGGYADYRRAQARLLAQAHAVVLVLDGQLERSDANVEMAAHLREDLDARGLDLGSLPVVQQQNKSDLPNFRGGAAFAEVVGLEDLPWVQTCAATGDGVLDVLKAISRPLLAR